MSSITPEARTVCLVCMTYSFDVYLIKFGNTFSNVEYSQDNLYIFYRFFRMSAGVFNMARKEFLLCPWCLGQWASLACLRPAWLSGKWVASKRGSAYGMCDCLQPALISSRFLMSTPVDFPPELQHYVSILSHKNDSLAAVFSVVSRADWTGILTHKQPLR